MHRSGRSPRRQWRRRSTSIAIAITAALVAGACTAAPPTPTGPSSRSFCNFFDRAADDPPTEAQALLVKDDVVAFAQDTTVVGDKCTDQFARVDLDGAALAEGEEVSSVRDDPDAEPIAVVTGDEIAAEEPVLDNVKFRALSAYIDLNGITVVGNVDVRLSGVTSTIGFSGTVRDLQNWSLSLSSSSLSVPGVTTSPATFSGSLVVTNGVPALTLNASVPGALIGDISIQAARISLNASPATGVKASVSGDVRVGSSSFAGSVAVVFDSAGALVSAKADVSVRLRGVSGPQQYIDLSGRITVDGNAASSTINFSGSGRIGELQVNRANGTLTLLGNRTTFVGVIDVVVGGVSVRYNGSIVWENGVASMPYFNLQAGGQYSGVLDDGQLVRVSGLITTQIVNGGVLQTTVTGEFVLGSLRATGSAIVETDGPSTVLFVYAEVDNPDFEGALSGVVYLYNGSAQLVDLEVTSLALQVALEIGDLSVTNARVGIRSESGQPLQFELEGDVAVDDKVTGSAAVAMTLGPDGSVLGLDGEIDADVEVDGVALTAHGDLLATSGQLTLTLDAEARIGNLTIPVDGTFVSQLGTPVWAFESEPIDITPIDGINLKGAKVRLWAGDPRIVNARFDAKWLLTWHTLTAEMKLASAGGCESIALGGSYFAQKALEFGLAISIVDKLKCNRGFVEGFDVQNYKGW